MIWKSMKKTKETKSWLSKNIDHTIKHLVNVAKRKGEKTQIINNKRRDITTDSTDIKRILKEN